MKAVTRKRYTAEFKAQAVGLVGLGKPVPEVAEDLGIGTSILYGWVRKGAQPGSSGAEGCEP
ncbi:MAG: transposase [Chthoniobacter sp.]|jgi:transposase-like protein|nr:transposase [Chthoniobacter sp.]